MPYAAPIDDMRFTIDTVAPLAGLVDDDVAQAVLNEAGKFATGELDPLNQPADRVGSILENGVVRRHRGGSQCAEIGAGLRLGQVHRAGPFAGDQLVEIALFLFRRTMRLQ